MKGLKYAIPPRSVISLLKIKEDCDVVLLGSKCPAYGRFHRDKGICGGVQLPEADLGRGDVLPFLHELRQSKFDHPLTELADAEC